MSTTEETSVSLSKSIELLTQTVGVLVEQQNLQGKILLDFVAMLSAYECQALELQSACHSLANNLNSLSDSVKVVIDGFFALSNHNTTPSAFKGLIIK